MADSQVAQVKAAAAKALTDWVNSPGQLGAEGGGMLPMSLNTSSSSSATSAAGAGSKFGFDSSGWTVNVGGSGAALQSAGAMSPMMLVGLAVVAFLILRK